MTSAAPAASASVEAAASRAGIVGVGHAVPPAIDQQVLWDSFFGEYYNGISTARSIWRRSGIETRHAVIDPRTEPDVIRWSTGDRMQRYVPEALPLGRAAIERALASAGCTADEMGFFAVVSSTGYATPGLDILLARDVGMGDDLQRLLVGHMGCGAAIPGLEAVADYVAQHGRPGLLLCIELHSLHVQPQTATVRGKQPTVGDVQQMVVHAIFGDAACAVVLAPAGPKELGGAAARFEIEDSVVRTGVGGSTFHAVVDVTDHGFRATLARELPDVVAEHTSGLVDELLVRNGLERQDVAGWAVHPGGRRVLEVVEERLGVGPTAMAPSYAALRGYGNCASATVLLILEQLLTGHTCADGAPIVMLSTGPGLTLYAVLMRSRR